MSNSLNAVAIDVVGQYGLASKNLVNAYRVGTQRAAEKMSERYTSMIASPSLPMVNDTLRSSILSAHQQLTGLFIGGVARATEQADLAIDKITDGTTLGIKRLGNVGERFESMMGAPVVETVTTLNMPAAKLSLQIAGQVVEGSKRLVERVAAVEGAVQAAAEPVVEVKARAKRAAAE